MSEVKKGYSLQSTMSYLSYQGTIAMPARTHSLIDVQDNGTEYSYVKYGDQNANEDYPTADRQDRKAYLTANPKDGVASVVSLGFDNNPKYTPFSHTDLESGTTTNDYTWADAGFENAFEYLNPSDFLLTDTVYQYQLDLTAGNDKAYTALATQLYGDRKFELKDFTLTTDGANPVSYTAHLWAKTSFDPNVNTYDDVLLTGTFVSVGKDVPISRVQKIEGASNDLLRSAFEKLAEGNYAVDSKIKRLDASFNLVYSMEYEGKVFGGNAISFDAYALNPDGSRTDDKRALLFKDEGSSTVNQYTLSAANTYYQSNSYAGNLSEGVLIGSQEYARAPGFEIAPTLFEENAGNGVRSYRIRTDLPGISIPFSGVYSPFTNGSIQNLVITVNEDLSKVTIADETPYFAETLVFTDIGTATDPFEGLSERNKDDPFTWADLLYNDPQKASLSDAIPDAALKAVPLFLNYKGADNGDYVAGDPILSGSVVSVDKENNNAILTSPTNIVPVESYVRAQLGFYVDLLVKDGYVAKTGEHVNEAGQKEPYTYYAKTVNAGVVKYEISLILGYHVQLPTESHSNLTVDITAKTAF